MATVTPHHGNRDIGKSGIGACILVHPLCQQDHIYRSVGVKIKKQGV